MVTAAGKLSPTRIYKSRQFERFWANCETTLDGGFCIERMEFATSVYCFGLAMDAFWSRWGSARAGGLQASGRNRITISAYSR
jgi:hypothetical protein